MKTKKQLLNEKTIDALIHEGKEIRILNNTSDNSPDDVGVGNLPDFVAWRTKVLHCFSTSLGTDNHYYMGLKSSLPIYSTLLNVIQALSILQAVRQDLEAGHFEQVQPQHDVIGTLVMLCERFDKVVKQLRKRHGNKPTLDVENEYDVQDLLHALLMVHFDDIRPEEWTPSYAGTSSRIDFFLQEHDVMIEVKKTRSNLKNRETGDQLAIDIERYSTHPFCKLLFCFVYDPDGYIANPTGFENSFNRPRKDLDVKVMVRPS
ncbi:hypothetical protein ABZR88_09675 [Mucilaginibacter yixingensis]|nr:hypothetical protein [Mucilaginibacter yixingensis]